MPYVSRTTVTLTGTVSLLTQWFNCVTVLTARCEVFQQPNHPHPHPGLSFAFTENLHVTEQPPFTGLVQRLGNILMGDITFTGKDRKGIHSIWRQACPPPNISDSIRRSGRFPKGSQATSVCDQLGSLRPNTSMRKIIKPAFLAHKVSGLRWQLSVYGFKSPEGPLQ